MDVIKTTILEGIVTLQHLRMTNMFGKINFWLQ